MIKKTPYRKFIILSSPRSGTHMIRTILKNHPNIASRSELFNPDFLKNLPFDENTSEEIILNKHIYRKYPPRVETVGFVIHRSGTPWGDWPHLWKMLEEETEIMIISLRRKNLLRRYLSYQLMQIYKEAPVEPLTIDPEELKNEFERHVAEIEEFDRRFSSHPILKICYEDLCNNYFKTIKRIQHFLKVEPLILSPEVKAKPKRKLSEAIDNYDELRTYFAQTKWKSFFKDKEKIFHIPISEHRFFFWRMQYQLKERIAALRIIRPFIHLRQRYQASWFELFTMLIKNALVQNFHKVTKSKISYYRDLPNTGMVFYSQKLEELLIRSFFQNRRNGVFLDVGCAWPLYCSTTCYLEKKLGWSGIAVDANPLMNEDWKKYRPKTQVFKFIVSDHSGTREKFYHSGPLGSIQKEREFKGRIIRGEETEVPTITISKLLDEHKITKIDFLSMDIEGAEMEALAGFDINRFQPDLVCIEFDLHLKREILAYFESHHYELITQFVQYDRTNRYFTPKSRTARII